CDALNNWQETLRKIDTSRLKVTALLGRTDTNEISESLSELQQLTEDLALLPELHGDERLDALPQLRNENLQAFRVYLDQFCKIQDLYKCLSEYVSPVLLEDLNLVDHLKDSCVGLKKLGAAKDIDLNTIISIIQRIDRLEDRLREIQVSMAEIGQHLDPAFQKNIKLHEKGLRELYNFIEFTVALDPELWNIRHERFDNEELDRVLPDLQSRITNLRMRHVSLSRTYKLKQLPQVSELEEIQALLSKTGFLCWFKRDWRVARRRLLALASKPDQGVNSLLDNIDELISFARDKEALNDDQALPQLLGEHFRGLDTNADRLLKIRSWYQQVRRRYGVGFGPKVELGQALISMPVDVSKGIRSLVDQGLLAVITESLEELTHLKTLFSMVEGLQRKDLQLIGDVGGLTQLKKQLANLVDPFQNYFSKQDLSIAEIDVLTCDLIRLRDLSAEWKDSDIDSKWFGSTLGLTIASGHDYTAALNAAEHTESLASILDDKIKTSALKQAIYNTPERSYFNELRECGKQLLEVWSEHKESLDAFKALTELNFTKWIEDSGDELSALTLRNDHALENPEWLANWLDYVRVRSTTIESGLGCLVDAVEQGTLSPDDVESGYYLAVYDYLSREILREVPTLAQFSGDVQESIRRQFCEYDQTIKHLQRERIAWQVAQNDVPPGVSGPKASDYTERALLKKECAKQKRHIPVRQLVKRAGNALAALKPCFMMGPMSVAQYLAPGMLYFDLVVMDEASQMKPEEAIGAVARGSQLVVVGDPKQLPPTSFFDKLVDDEDEDLTAIEESESILDAVSPLFIGRRLRWHYRSRHESLICFSNQSFYGGELILFPSPHSESDEFGVKFTRIPKGKFVNRRNLEEAHIIAETVKRHLLKHPEESLGVVAMNVEQRDQIERAVEMLAKEDELLQIAMDRNQSTIEPLFVKNLENVQGDERDVIFISMTYGPQETGGRVMQRFGPINSVNGWRRLNVLFTRAKKRMHVFSSMSSEDIVLSSSSKRGVEALRDFLSFAETGILYKTSISGREPDSDFEIAVAGALRSAGFECVPQVGVAGFYIDIAVRDPGNPGSFLMGIECDGASYHSAKSVCDRDRLRQAILEQLGWNIRRIWSTDWYKNPQAQLQSIIRELNALKTQEVAIPHVKSETEEIESIVESAEEEEQVSASTAGAETLLERLLKFDQEVIRKACPDTPENKRLLRPAMLDALIENMPTSKWEFQESIPAYLRLETSAEDGKYLGRVLEIIDEASIS
ncbi:MAG: AAA domain-containing protein, partial [Candidatus Dojkabacteria bacterium]